MASTGKRDNAYWLQRFEKDGHRSLLDRVAAGEITVYKASQLAGYREQGRRSASANLAHHWKRATAAERKRFVLEHLKDVNRVMLEVREDLLTAKADKTRESEQK